jgi:hypothetical protein
MLKVLAWCCYIMVGFTTGVLHKKPKIVKKIQIKLDFVILS